MYIALAPAGIFSRGSRFTKGGLVRWSPRRGSGGCPAGEVFTFFQNNENFPIFDNFNENFANFLENFGKSLEKFTCRAFRGRAELPEASEFIKN